MTKAIDTHYHFANFFDSPVVKVLAYLLSAQFEEGHTCLTYQKFIDQLSDKRPLLMDEYQLQAKDFKLDKMLSESCITTHPNERQPFVYDNGNFYIQRYYQYESEIIAQIEAFAKAEKDSSFSTSKLLQHQSFIKALFSEYASDAATKEENVQWQCVAAISAVLSNFSIITGGPGTGKTTTVAKVLALIFAMQPDCKVALAAPTGKAAARMKESLLFAKENLSALNDDIKDKFEDIEAGTIHRLLGYIKNSPYFKANANSPLDADIVVVDESSMIGTALMAKLLTAVRPTAKVILLGDKNQLASVEAGSIFGDICLTQAQANNMLSHDRATLINGFVATPEAQIYADFIRDNGERDLLANHVVELKRSYRFKGEEAIGIFSKAVVEGRLTKDIIAQSQSGNGQSVLLATDYSQERRHDLYAHYADYIKEEDTALALKKFNNIRILCAVRDGIYGVDHYNNEITDYLQQRGWIQATKGFYHNQPIMMMQNDYQLKLYNGDIGLIRQNEKGELLAYFETTEGITKIHTSRLSVYQTVFAMTIHKSQGSEFNHVGVVLPNDEESQILTRELIYTGITRAKLSATIFGTEAVLFKGVARQVERASGITSRLQNTL